MILILLLAAKFQHVKKIDDVIEAVDPGWTVWLAVPNVYNNLDMSACRVGGLDEGWVVEEGEGGVEGGTLD